MAVFGSCQIKDSQNGLLLNITNVQGQICHTVLSSRFYGIFDCFEASELHVDTSSPNYGANIVRPGDMVSGIPYWSVGRVSGRSEYTHCRIIKLPVEPTMGRDNLSIGFLRWLATYRLSVVPLLYGKGY